MFYSGFITRPATPADNPIAIFAKSFPKRQKFSRPHSKSSACWWESRLKRP